MKGKNCNRLKKIKLITCIRLLKNCRKYCSQKNSDGGGVKCTLCMMCCVVGGSSMENLSHGSADVQAHCFVCCLSLSKGR